MYSNTTSTLYTEKTSKSTVFQEHLKHEGMNRRTLNVHYRTISDSILSPCPWKSVKSTSRCEDEKDYKNYKTKRQKWEMCHESTRTVTQKHFMLEISIMNV